MLDSRKIEIRKCANAFREKCKIYRYGILDLFKECERFEYKLIRYPLGEFADLGFSLRKDNDIIIFVNTSVRLSRVIFTLAHEIGHVSLHLRGDQTFIDDRNSLSDYNKDVFEQEANFFAICLLMPSDEVNRFFDLELSDYCRDGLTSIDIARIMSEFHVSYEAVLNRLETLGKIDKFQRIRLENEKIEKRVGNLLQCIGGNSRLNSICNDIDIPYEYLDYVIYNYNHNAIPIETLKKALSCYNLSVEDISDKIINHQETEDSLNDLIGRMQE